MNRKFQAKNLNKTEKAFIRFCAKHLVSDSNVVMYDKGTNLYYKAVMTTYNGNLELSVFKKDNKSLSYSDIICFKVFL